MALTSTTSLDVVSQISTISFYQGVSIVDQITFSSNTVTYQSISSYNLSKSDMDLYIKFLNVYLLLIYTNFPAAGQSINLAWPLCKFDITLSSSGVEHITYTQASQGNTFLTINYVPIASAASFSARVSPVTISIQEFISGVNFNNLFFNQVSLN